MIKGDLSNDTFSYRDQHRFNDNNFVLVIKDEEYPNTSVISILNYNNGIVLDIDEYEMGEKILATPNTLMDILPLSERFSLHQLLKISNGSIINNNKHREGSSFPQSITFHTNIHELRENEIIEIFEGQVFEEKSLFKISETFLEPLIRDVYLQSNNCFFVFNDNELKGPFKVTKTDTEGNFIVEKSLWKTFGLYEVNDKTFIEFSANNIKRKIIIPSFNTLKLISEIDFINDEELINKFKITLDNNTNDYSPQLIQNLLDLLKKTATSSLLKDDELKSNRIEALIKKSEKKLLQNLNIAKILPEIPEIKKELEVLEQKKLELKNDIEITEEKKNTLSLEIEKIKKDKDVLNDELVNLSKIKEEELKKTKSDLDLIVSELEERKIKLDEEIERERNDKSAVLQELETVIKFHQEKEKSLVDGIKTLQEEFTNEQKSAHDKLKALLTQNQHYNILSGRDFSYSNEKKNEYKIFQIENSGSINKSNKLKKYEEFKKQVINVLEKNNRKFEPHFIDNLLISIHQNTLTLFAGMPGTGKTSLVRILMQILTPKERVREISVSRGWTSQKDLIGFFNPLSKNFSPAPTNIYSLLKQLDWEVKENIHLESPLAYILLDEANLSPMEHYWSTFYNLTDHSAQVNSMPAISMSGDEILEYANNLRFIGTINYDQTTEELSPRVLDRANIIKMNPKTFDVNSLAKQEIENINLSLKDSIEFFDLLDFSEESRSISMDIEFEQKFNEIKKKFEDLKIYISPRVQISIKRYCLVAKNIMYEENKPLDYCIAQRLLPLIRVQGSNAKVKLLELNAILNKNKFDISSKILNEIIEAGAEGEIFEDNYNYFLTLSYV
jgi:energy-coupling factor transporter ATP-binding protein EcfA2